MLSILLLALSLSQPTPDRGLTFKAKVSVDHTHIALGDIADVSMLPQALRQRAAHLEVATFAPGRTHVSFSSGAVAQRARALMPALAPWMISNQRVSIVVDLTPARSAVRVSSASQDCLRAKAPLAAQAIPAESDFASAPCMGETSKSAFFYDGRIGAVRVSRPLRAGELVRAGSYLPMAAIKPHQPLYLRASIGAVIVERRVETLQVGWPGRRVFVRAEGGKAFAVTLPDALQ